MFFPLFFDVFLAPAHKLSSQGGMSGGLDVLIKKTLANLYKHSPPRTHVPGVGMLRFMSDIKQPSLPTPFYSVLVSISVLMALSTVLHSINSPDNSPFSHSVVPVLSLRYRFVYESLLQP